MILGYELDAPFRHLAVKEIEPYLFSKDPRRVAHHRQARGRLVVHDSSQNFNAAVFVPSTILTTTGYGK
jgi:hypothetical protein